MAALLADKTVLIVAKRLESLASLRTLVQGQQAGLVQVASSANMALSLLRMQSFDLCLIEHGLGEGEKNGYQVIEESVREGLKRAVDCQILILPEGSTSVANDSLESFADSFFVKPVSPQLFDSRLEKLLKLKKAVRPAEELVDQGEDGKAIQMIEQMLRKMPSLGPYLTRLQSRLLIQQQDYDRARRLLQNAADERGMSWAYMGMGICHYHEGHFAEAMACFNQVLERSPESIEAFDWLSRLYRVIGRNEPAQKLLEKAVAVHPTVPVLQSDLGDVASENSSWDVAIGAFRESVKYARHSCYQKPNNYFGLARCLQTKVSPQGGSHSSRAEQEAVRALEDVAYEYKDDRLIRFKSRLMTSETYKLSGDIKRANAAAQDAFVDFKKLDDSQQAEELDNLLEGLENTQLQTVAEEYKADFSRRVFTETEWGRNNLQGISFYRKGKFEEAFDFFLKALETVPNSPSVLLNLVQTGYELVQLQPQRATEILAVCNERLLNVSIGAMNSKQQDRFRALSDRRAMLSDPEFDA
ncbi:tetratricopeptide repeat protein [Motiliproteus sp.]|uniref:tetratricopeptide repeat protein n=1 Tax=Motiliproteus sp. TaxID=1898955 RepID=UPI003BAB66D0